ncbi:MAG: formylglycine-generating enzyme family protein [Deltaproteobacteria bacterium]|nr:formylglycine-generating enzyme family protein [Deltaproteobacteria bacterium]
MAQGPMCGAHREGDKWCDGVELKSCDAGKDKTLATCFSIERCDATSGKCEPNCPEGEVYVPATGPEGFKMGRNKIRNGEDHTHIVVLTKPFCMDETEVTAGAYEKCVTKGDCPEPGFADTWATWKKHPDYPLNLVSWTKANNYCIKQDKALPTEAQWDWVATAGDGREFPWGNELPDCEFMDYAPTGAPKWSPGGDWGCHGGGPSAVKKHPKGARVLPTGKIYDLTGNVWEWTADSYGNYPKEKQVDPVVPGKEGAGVYTIRGGGWNRPAAGCNSWYRGGAVVTYQVPGLGFRCVRNPK